MSPRSRRTPLLPLAEKWLRWKNTAKPSPHTLRARRNDLAVIATLIADSLRREAASSDADSFDRELSRLKLNDLTRDAVAEAFARYARGHEEASIRRARSTWNGFCSWLVTFEELLETNPVDLVQAPATKPWRPKPLSEQNLAQIITAARQPAKNARNPWPELEQALCAIFVGAGVRVSEVIALRVGDIHRSRTEVAKLRVTGKGKVTRTVPLPPEVVAVVDAYLVSRKARLGRYEAADPLLVRVTGKPLTPKAIDYYVSGWFRRASVAPPKGALAHSLRHTYATLLVEQSASVPEVQRLLGHASMSTTQAYIAVAAHGVEEAAMSNPARRLLADNS